MPVYVPTKENEQALERAFQAFLVDAEAEVFRDQILDLARRQNKRVEVIALAIADVLAMCIARLDRECDGLTLNDRLHDFCQRVEQRYEGMRNK